MNNNLYGNSKKFIVLLCVICLVFMVLIIKAFEYLPEAQNVNDNNNIDIVNINKPLKNVSENSENSDEKNMQDTSESEKIQSKMNFNNNTQKQPEEIPELENIEEIQEKSVIENDKANEKSSLGTASSMEDVFVNAQNYKNNKQYVKALEELVKIPQMTSDKNSIAKSYEEIANIYAVVKKYGSALSYAQKAYNTYPSSSREILLARLYYKTGDIDKATQRVNNVLRRDFSADRD